MDDDDQRIAELSSFLRKALEIELEDSARQLTEEELKTIALKSGLTETDWERLGERLEGHLGKGRNFLKFENFEAAAEELDQAAVLAPYRPNILSDCGEAHLRLWEKGKRRESRDRAEELFRRCLELDPGHAGAAKGLSQLRRTAEKKSRKGKAIAAALALLLLGGGSFLLYPSSPPGSQPIPGNPPVTITKSSGNPEAVSNLAVQRSGNLVAIPRFSTGGPAFPAKLPSDFTQIAVGFGDVGHVIALRSNGSVVAWGDNEFGQANPPEDLENVTQVAAGWRHGLALQEDGTVVAWGDNSDGQCDVPIGLTNVIQVSAGVRHSVALRADGSVVAWGDDAKGQSSVPADLGPVAKLAEICADHTVVITRDGKLAAWGDNSAGQCEVPNETIGSASVLRVLSGGENYALLDDGRLLHWGRPLKGTAFPAERPEVEAVFSGFPGTVVVRDQRGKAELFGAARKRPGLEEELAKWDHIIVGPGFFYGIDSDQE